MHQPTGASMKIPRLLGPADNQHGPTKVKRSGGKRLKGAARRLQVAKCHCADFAWLAGIRNAVVLTVFVS